MPAADSANPPEDADRLVRIARSYIGTPYRKGGMSRRGMDCSGFVWMVFNEFDGRKLPRSSVDMAGEGMSIQQRFLRRGDLLFFTSGPRRGPIDHVGIFLDGREFVHASSTLGVTISNLDDEYYASHFAFARRVLR